MSVPERDPDTGGRSLAEILREAGVESPTRTGRRRRWDGPEDTGVRQRGADDGSRGSAPQTGPARRRSDLVPPGEASRPGGARVFPEPSTAAIPGLRPSRKPSVPGAEAPEPGGEADGPPTGRDRRGRGRHTGPQVAVRSEQRQGADRRATDRRTGDRGATDRQPADREAADHPPGRSSVPDEPSTGPIPVVRDQLDEPPAPRESALAWLRFAVELVIALATGIGAYFAFTLLWEMVPQVAVLVAPLAVAGLVAGVGAWRQRHGREPVGVRLLAVLVFAGTLLTIAPAAGLLAAG